MPIAPAFKRISNERKRPEYTQSDIDKALNKLIASKNEKTRKIRV